MDVESTQVLGQPAQAFSNVNILNWLLALLMVLGLFFICVWMLRKFSQGLGQAHPHKMRIVGGIALGLREKVVLLQVGTKQLVLAVTPGRIKTLTVLEGDDCLVNSAPASHSITDTQFAQKLMQALKNRSDV
ncbi:MAG: flagellar biosynthetic protein FliO [Methylococcales bacterium]